MSTLNEAHQGQSGCFECYATGGSVSELKMHAATWDPGPMRIGTAQTYAQTYAQTDAQTYAQVLLPKILIANLIFGCLGGRLGGRLGGSLGGSLGS